MSQEEGTPTTALRSVDFEPNGQTLPAVSTSARCWFSGQIAVLPCVHRMTSGSCIHYSIDNVSINSEPHDVLN